MRSCARCSRKIYPDHWSFYFGEFALYAFALLVGNGRLADVRVRARSGACVRVGRGALAGAPIGYLVRQVHHWSAVIFVAAILFHMARIFFTAAFRKPRELTWVAGVILLALASLAGFTGYSLPFDELSGTGLRIARSVLLSIPLAGGWLGDVLTGGGFPGPLLLAHLYTVHVYFLPVAIALVLAVHLGMVVYQKHTQFDPDEPTRRGTALLAGLRVAHVRGICVLRGGRARAGRLGSDQSDRGVRTLCGLGRAQPGRSRLVRCVSRRRASPRSGLGAAHLRTPDPGGLLGREW